MMHNDLNFQLKSLHPRQLKKIHDMLLVTRILNIPEIVESIRVSRGTGILLLNFSLGKRKLSVR